MQRDRILGYGLIALAAVFVLFAARIYAPLFRSPRTYSMPRAHGHSGRLAGA